MAIISRLEVDMATKTVQIDTAIPVSNDKNALCLEDKTVQKYVYQAYWQIFLDSAQCRYRRIGRNPCFECQRVRKAA